ncbi:arginase-1-like [Glandiceps talaboti]
MAQNAPLPSKNIGVLGVPIHTGQQKQGVQNGPTAMKDAGLIEKIKELENEVEDYGDIVFIDIEDDPPFGITKNPRNVGAANKKISDMVSKVIQDNRMCISLGGDHSMAIGTIHGHAQVQPNVCVIWVDAHTDINTPLTSDSGNIHGQPLSFLIHELKEYVPQVPGFEWVDTVISAKDVAYIGVRSIDEGERAITDMLGMNCFSIDVVDKLGIVEVVEKAINSVNPNGDRPIHLSFDIDSLDPNEAASTGTPVRGGLTLREGMYIVEQVYKTGLLAGMDMVEVNPELGNTGQQEKTVNAAVEIITAAVGSKRYGNKPSDYELPKPEPVEA